MANNGSDVEAIYERAAAYGVQFTGEMVGPDYHDTVDYSRRLTLAQVAAAGGKISRLRLLSDRGFPFWDVSYCHAKLPDGSIVTVNTNGHSQFPRRGLKAALIQWAKDEGVFAKGIGLLDEGNWSTLVA